MDENTDYFARGLAFIAIAIGIELSGHRTSANLITIAGVFFMLVSLFVKRK